ncbi:aminotransferase class I/II-fold pyridoxal phosphate-dependent enzyme [Streptomyces sp. NPDC048664]|uniref:aminotransferase class I/II-fold pyridoxal phosphate-dependent enzyme n=1 Tax=Streptomyces sp. NPDC048664 TaxID=3154505 RepID=UPI0034409DE6
MNSEAPALSTPLRQGHQDGPEFIDSLDLLRRRRTLKWQIGAPDPDRICLGVAEMDVAVPRFLRTALTEAVGDGETGYGLCARQEEACARYLQDEHGASIAGARCTTDVLTGLRTLMGLQLEPGSGVIVETPVYGDLLTVVREAGHVPVAVPLIRGTDGYRHDWAALTAAAEAGARAWILCQPHNPVGRAWTAEETARAVSLSAAHDLLVLANEVHIPLGLSAVQPRSVFADPRTHEVRAFGLTSASKAFNIAGLKSATVYASQRTADALSLTPQSLLGRPGSLGAIATVACYEQGLDWLRALRRELAACAAVALDELGSLGLEVSAAPPEATYLVWAEFPRPDQARAVAGALEAAGVHTLPGAGFGGPSYEHCFRVNAAAHPVVLRHAFARLRSALRTRGRSLTP